MIAMIMTAITHTIRAATIRTDTKAEYVLTPAGSGVSTGTAGIPFVHLNNAGSLSDPNPIPQIKNGIRTSGCHEFEGEELYGSQLGSCATELLLLFCQLLRKVHDLDVFSQAK